MSFGGLLIDAPSYVFTEAAGEFGVIGRPARGLSQPVHHVRATGRLGMEWTTARDNDTGPRGALAARIGPQTDCKADRSSRGVWPRRRQKVSTGGRARSWHRALPHRRGCTCQGFDKRISGTTVEGKSTWTFAAAVSPGRPSKPLDLCGALDFYGK